MTQGSRLLSSGAVVILNTWPSQSLQKWGERNYQRDAHILAKGLNHSQWGSKRIAKGAGIFAVCPRSDNGIVRASSQSLLSTHFPLRLSQESRHTWIPKDLVYLLYWIGQRVHLGFSIWCNRETWINFLANPIYLSGFSGGSKVNHPPANAGGEGLIPGSGKSPGEGNGKLAFLPGKPYGQRSLAGYSHIYLSI